MQVGRNCINISIRFRLLNLPYETSMYLSSSFASSSLGKSLLCVATVVLFGSTAGMVEASCGDYLEHGTSEEAGSTFAEDRLPASPSTPSCRNGQCKRLPAAPPSQRPSLRLIDRQYDGICNLTLLWYSLNLLHWTVSNCVCPRVIAREALLRPPIA